MLQAYQGYFQDGRFMSPDMATIPNDVKVYVIVADELPKVKTKAQLQNEALREFSAAMKEISDEPLDDEFDSIVSKRFSIPRESTV